MIHCATCCTTSARRWDLGNMTVCINPSLTYYIEHAFLHDAHYSIVAHSNTIFFNGSHNNITVRLNSSKLPIAQSCLGKEIQSFNAYGTKDLQNGSSRDFVLRVFIELLRIHVLVTIYGLYVCPSILTIAFSCWVSMALLHITLCPFL